MRASFVGGWFSMFVGLPLAVALFAAAPGKFVMGVQWLIGTGIR